MLFVPRVVVPWCPATPALPPVHPGRWDGVAFLCEVLFCFHDHTNCNKLYKKTLASPKVWQQPFSVWAEGTRLSYPLLLHHTCPSASSPSAPGVFGPFSQADFSAVFPTPVLLAASCQTANKTHSVGKGRGKGKANDRDAGNRYRQSSLEGERQNCPPQLPHAH